MTMFVNQGNPDDHLRFAMKAYNMTTAELEAFAEEMIFRHDGWEQRAVQNELITKMGNGEE